MASNEQPIDTLTIAALAVCLATSESGANFAALRAALVLCGRQPEEWPDLIEAVRGHAGDTFKFAEVVERWVEAAGDVGQLEVRFKGEPDVQGYLDALFPTSEARRALLESAGLIPAQSAPLPILRHPDPRLYMKSTPVEPHEFGVELDAFMDQMVATMLAPRVGDGKPQGAGLAAPQVGRNVRCVVMVNGVRVLKLVNPRVLLVKGGKEEADEGCLSVPGEDVRVERSKQILARYQRPDTGAFEDIILEGFEARCLQHEIDHLDGITLVKRMRPGRRFTYERKHGKVLEVRDAG